MKKVLETNNYSLFVLSQFNCDVIKTLYPHLYRRAVVFDAEVGGDPFP